MLFKMYAIYDMKSRQYASPMLAVNDEVALRMFEEIAADKSGQVGRHPDDYQLILIGEYDDSSGECQATKQALLGVATQFYVRADQGEEG